jgi:hypothetical protein
MATLATFFRSHAAEQANVQAPASGDAFELRALPNDHIYFYSKRIDNSRMVRQANPAAAQESWSAMGAVVVLLMLGASIIAPHVASVLAGYRLEALKQERQAMMDQDRALSVREAALLSPRRLIELAASRRLASPAVDQIVHLENVAADVAVASVKTTSLRNSQ